MNNIKFLNEADVIELNTSILNSRANVIKPNELTSAVYSIAQTFGGNFLYESIFNMAAHLCYALAENHCFNDGNKRTASLATLSFLENNSISIENIDQIDLGYKTLDLLLHRMSEEEFARYLKKICK